MRNLFTAAGLSLLAVACGADAEPEGPAPTLRVTSPERGTIRNQLGTVEVRGTVTPGEGGADVESVMVNGVAAAVSADGSFTAVVASRAGATLIQTVATDADGQFATDTRTMLSGAKVTPDALIADAITAGISADAFEKMGVVAGNMMAATDVHAMMEPMNPVLNAGADAGEDCLWIKGDVEAFEVRDPTIRLIPYSGGLRLEADFFDIYVPIDARYEVACISARDDLTIRAQRVSLAGDLDIYAENGGLKVNLENLDLDIAGLDLDATGVPGAALSLFNVESLVEWVFELGVEKFMEPTINELMAGIGGLETQLDLMGHTLDLSIIPGQIEFDPAGAQVRLDTRFFFQGTEDSAGFIFTENSLPAMGTTAGFELALADDAVNQLLSSAWATGIMSMNKPVDGGAFDGTLITATMPPMISADPSSGELRLFVGDLSMAFQQHGVTQAEVVVNLVIDLTIEPGAQFLKLGLGHPEMYVDSVDGVTNQTGFTDADLEAMIPLSLEHEMHVIAPLIESVPVPAFGGVSLVDLGIAGQNGYVTVTGALQ